jgi:beta-galactosidase
LFRIPKFDFYFFQSQRDPNVHVDGVRDGPMVFIANYATFQSPNIVTVFSNCQEVRLSMTTRRGRAGTQMSEQVIATQKPMEGYALPHPPFTFKIGQISEEQSTMYMTGIAPANTAINGLKAEGLIDGKVVATYTVNHPGTPAKLRLEADASDKDLVADGADWIRVHAYITDARGTTHPFANDEVTFTVSGEGTIINDDRIKANPTRAEAGIATVLVRGTTHAGDITIHATAPGLSPAELTFKSTN